MQKIFIRGIGFDDVNIEEALDISLGFLEEAYPHIIHTPNAETVQLCYENPEMYKVINSADLIIPDGSGVILASRLLGTPLKKGKVAGVELGERIIAEAAKNRYGVFLLGGKPGVADTAAEKLKQKYTGLNICGTNDGYFSGNRKIIDKINESGADILIVCLGVPKQEIWMLENKNALNVKLMLGLGGSIDIYAGTAKRAPKIFIKLGLEWFYRLLREPRRIGRMMKIPKFIFGILLYGIKEKRYKAKRL